MAEVSIHSVELKLTTVKLSAKLLKQFERVEYKDIKHLLVYSEEQKRYNLDPTKVVGWIHGSVIDGDHWRKYLLIQLEEGSYGLFDCIEDTAKKFKQIYLA